MHYGKIIFIFFLLWGATVASQAQNIYFKFTNSTNAQYPLSDIRSITYAANSMNLNMVSGSTVSIAMDTINNFNYKSVNVNTAISNTVATSHENAVSIYPNPSNGQFNLSFNVLEPGSITIEFITINGEILRSFCLPANGVGAQTVTLNAIDNRGKYLSTGIYLCRLTTAQHSTTKKLIINQ